MSARRRTLSIENLESRLNLSSLGGVVVPASGDFSVVTQDRSSLNGRATMFDSLTSIEQQYLTGGKNGGTTNTTTLAAPSSLGATTGTSSIGLKWVNNGGSVSGFRVYRSTDGVNFSLLGSVGRTRTSYTDSAVTPGVSYSYYVVAYNSSTVSAASNVATGTIAAVTAPAAPTSFAAGTIGSDTVSLAWSDNAGNESGYHLYRSTDGVNYTLVGDLAANTTSFTDTGLSAGTQYTYELAAWNSAGETYAASPLTFSTQSLAPVAPSGPISYTTTPVTISTRNMTSFTELRIDGTSGNDSIYVTQASGVLTITANGQTYTYNNTFGDLMIEGYAGDDSITVDSSVNIATLIYGGDGNNTLQNLTTGKATIVSIGNGANTVTGNGLNTSYWVNPNDVVNASSTEIGLGGVNRVNQFYQPWSTSASNVDYIPRDLYGQNLRDPSDAGAQIRLTNSSFWGTGATMNDVNQTSLADCYYLAPLSSLAKSEPQRLMNMGVDLGDGTYAVRFVRNGVTSYVRVDGDLSAGGWNYGLANQTPGANGNQWASIFEKAYAFFRNGQNSYSSLNYGYQTQSLQDLGLNASTASPSAGISSTYNLITTQLAASHAMVASTVASITSGAPLIGSHCYSIIGAYYDSTGTLQIQLRNPWGIDGAGNDGLDDGIVTVSYSQFSANFNQVAYSLT